MWLHLVFVNVLCYFGWTEKVFNLLCVLFWLSIVAELLKIYVKSFDDLTCLFSSFYVIKQSFYLLSGLEIDKYEHICFKKGLNLFYVYLKAYTSFFKKK